MTSPGATAAEPRYPFVHVDVSAEEAEELSALLFELGATGVEERDQQTLARGQGAGVTLVASFDSHEEAEEAVRALSETPGASSPRVEEILGDAWRDAWKEHFKPFSLTPSLTVTPPWVPYERQRPDELVLELEPGRAFGTGLHATTSLVAEALHAHRARLDGARVLDVGCGSGILGFVALLFGAREASLIDVDPEVLDVVRENAERNRLEGRVRVSCTPIEAVEQAYPVVLANIEARVLVPMAPELARVLEPGGLLILSGILATEHDSLVERYTSLDRPLRHLGSSQKGEGEEGWVAIVLTTP